MPLWRMHPRLDFRQRNVTASRRLTMLARNDASPCVESSGTDDDRVRRHRSAQPREHGVHRRKAETDKEPPSV